MKTFYFLFPLLGFLASCQMAKNVNYRYDDLYDAAEKKTLADDANGYADLIKDNEKDHEVVIEKPRTTAFGGYYPSNTINSNTSNFDDCNCRYRVPRSPYFYAMPNWVAVSCGMNLSYIDCDCNRQFDPLFYHTMSFGNAWNLYGYYDYWGGWHPYYPYDMDPYGYYSFYYGWTPNYFWYENMNNQYYNNGWPNNNWTWFNNGGITQNKPNYHYGHRNSTSTSSSNTTVYAHTVKLGEIEKPKDEPVLTEKFEPAGNSFSTGGATSKPIVATESVSKPSVYVFGESEKNIGTSVSNTDNFSKIEPTSAYTSSGTSSAVTAKPNVTSTNNVSVATSGTGNSINANSTSSTSPHVVAGNTFAFTTSTGQVSRTGGSTSGNQTVNPHGTANNSGTNSGYVNSTTGKTTSNGTFENKTTSDSRRTSTTTTSSSGSNNSSSSSRSGTYNGSSSSGHRSGTTGSSGSTSSGGTRTSGSSRR